MKFLKFRNGLVLWWYSIYCSEQNYLNSLVQYGVALKFLVALGASVVQQCIDMKNAKQV